MEQTLAARSAIQALPAAGLRTGLFPEASWALSALEPLGHGKPGCAFPGGRRTRGRPPFGMCPVASRQRRVILRIYGSEYDSGGNLRHEVQVVTLKTVGSARGPERLRLLRVAMDFTPDHLRWAKNRQRFYGRSRDYYLDMITAQNGCCAFSGVALRFDAVSGTSIARGIGCHPLYAAFDHRSPGSDAGGHHIVSYALNDLKGHLPLDCFLELSQTRAWQRLMEEWRQQAAADPNDREGFRAILCQRTA